MTTRRFKPREVPNTISIQLGDLVPAQFQKRVNRFVVQVTYQDKRYPAHLANPGRLEELLTPGRRLWIRPVQDPSRKTQFDVVLVALDHTLVSVNAHLPNRIIARALDAGTLPGLHHIQSVRREIKHGASRIDFVVEENHTARWIEVKSVTLVVKGIARFPDAPTQRGTRHLCELRRIVQVGGNASVIFVIQRDDARAFAPNDEMDSTFGAALRAAAEAGVELHAVRCQVTRDQIQLEDEVPVCLDSPIL